MAKKIQSNFAIRIAAESAELRKGLNEVQGSLKGFESKISTVGKLVAGAFTADAVLKFAKKVIDSSQALGDEWSRNVQSMQQVTDTFFTSLANGNLTDFIGRLREAVEVGREYYNVLDDLGDRKRELSIAEIDARRAVLEYRQVLDDVTKSDQERIEAGKAIINIEDQLATKRVENAKLLYDAELERVSALTTLSRAEIENYLRNYSSLSDLLKLGQDYNNLLNQRANLQFVAPGETPVQSQQRLGNLEKINKELANATETQREWARIAQNIPVDADLDKITNAYIELGSAQNSVLENTITVNRRLSALLKRVDDSDSKTNEEVEKARREKEAIRKELEAIDALLKSINQPTRIGGPILPTDGIPQTSIDPTKVLQVTPQLQEQKATIDELAASWSGLTNAFQYSLQSNEDFLDSFLGYFKTWIKSMIAELASLAIVAGILSAITGGSFGAIFKTIGGSKFTNLFGGGFASGGTTSSPFYIAGEAGAELIANAGTSKIFTAAQTERMLKGNDKELVAVVRGQDLAFILKQNSTRENRM